jgi:DNA mismatch endonuclease, patch repair protein
MVHRSRTLGVPYPHPSRPAMTAIMRGNRRTDTLPELAIRRLLHASGLRYRVDYPLIVGDVRVRPDVVFPRRRVAVFVDGCFWHGCPTHGTRPAANPAYWSAKLARNRARDRRVDAALHAHGWRVIRAWEHDFPRAVARRVADVLRRSRVAGSPPSSS